ncbi:MULTISPECIES: hypothetical protein [Bacteroidota]|jgi:hypothetical protein|uniref:Uncharacterized protein n=1 Tax=Flectobacillus rivi TaxID=2984209 RepID=A0ABT6Z0T6_9BACT|nr:MULTISPECIES: hypothetical protein [Bacteroidota]MDI9874703.1 hypothetical protein [Flectobacillus rivi]NBB29405.1 hypothetical protein [Cellulophaga sp. BC115SP]
MKKFFAFVILLTGVSVGLKAQVLPLSPNITALATPVVSQSGLNAPVNLSTVSYSPSLGVANNLRNLVSLNNNGNNTIIVQSITNGITTQGAAIANQVTTATVQTTPNSATAIIAAPTAVTTTLLNNTGVSATPTVVIHLQKSN